MIIDRNLSSSVSFVRSVATTILHHKRPYISRFDADMVANHGSVTVREATVQPGGSASGACLFYEERRW